MLDVSVSCTWEHILSQRDARLRPLLVRALGLDTSEGTRYHRDAVDGLPSSDRYPTACLGRIGPYSETGAT